MITAEEVLKITECYPEICALIERIKLTIPRPKDQPTPEQLASNILAMLPKHK